MRGRRSRRDRRRRHREGRVASLGGAAAMAPRGVGSASVRHRRSGSGGMRRWARKAMLRSDHGESVLHSGRASSKPAHCCSGIVCASSLRVLGRSFQSLSQFHVKRRARLARSYIPNRYADRESRTRALRSLRLRARSGYRKRRKTTLRCERRAHENAVAACRERAPWIFGTSKVRERRGCKRAPTPTRRGEVMNARPPAPPARSRADYRPAKTPTAGWPPTSRRCAGAPAAG